MNEFGDRVVLVGEVNPHNYARRYALWPWPKGAAGDRLCRLVLGLEVGDYLRFYARTNLCEGRWETAAARVYAGELLAVRPQGIVALGRRVSAAFGAGDLFTRTAVEGVSVVVLPHPSGLCRVWNEPGSYDRARGLLDSCGFLRPGRS